MRNADASIRARIHFAEESDNPHVQKLIDGIAATAVTWEVQGLRPHSTFHLQVRFAVFYFRQLICREFGDLRRVNLSTGNTLKNILTMKYLVICGGESGWRYRTPEDGDSVLVRDAPLLIADAEGKAQGISIERGLRVQDVIGRMIVIQEIGKVYKEGGDVNERKKQRRQGLALGVIGCQCVSKPS